MRFDRMDRQFLHDVLEWDVANWTQALLFWQEAAGDIHGQRVLDVGARNGGLSLYFAMRGCEVVCSDLNGPSEKAVELHRRYGVQSRIQYAKLDAADLQCPDEEFDIVCFKSILGAVGANDDFARQKQAVGEMYRVLKPGGHLLFAENLRASPLHSASRRLFVPWARYWRYVTLNEIRDMFAGFDELRLGCFGFCGAFGRSEAQRRFLHRIDVFLDSLLPNSFKYIVFGCAAKKRASLSSAALPNSWEGEEVQS